MSRPTKAKRNKKEKKCHITSEKRKTNRKQHRTHTLTLTQTKNQNIHHNQSTKTAPHTNNHNGSIKVERRNFERCFIDATVVLCRSISRYIVPVLNLELLGIIKEIRLPQCFVSVIFRNVD